MDPQLDPAAHADVDPGPLSGERDLVDVPHHPLFGDHADGSSTSKSTSIR